MSRRGGTGLLMVRRDIEADFNRWYDEGNISGCSGSGLSQRRSLGRLKGGPKYLGQEIKGHDEERSARTSASQNISRSQAAKIGMSRVGPNFLRRAYRQIFRCTLTRSRRPSKWLRFLQLG